MESRRRDPGRRRPVSCDLRVLSSPRGRPGRARPAKDPPPGLRAGSREREAQRPEAWTRAGAGAGTGHGSPTRPACRLWPPRPGPAGLFEAPGPTRSQTGKFPAGAPPRSGPTAAGRKDQDAQVLTGAPTPFPGTGHGRVHERRTEVPGPVSLGKRGPVAAEVRAPRDPLTPGRHHGGCVNDGAEPSRRTGGRPRRACPCTPPPGPRARPPATPGAPRDHDRGPVLGLGTRGGPDASGARLARGAV